MVYLDAIQSHAGFFGAGRRADLVRALKAHAAYRGTLRRLKALSDKQLADLGFRREDLKSVARDASYTG